MNYSRLIVLWGVIGLVLASYLGSSLSSNSQTDDGRLTKQQENEFPNYLKPEMMGLWKADSFRTISSIPEENHLVIYPQDSTNQILSLPNTKYGHEILMFYNKDSIGMYSLESEIKTIQLDSAHTAPCFSGIFKISVVNQEVLIRTDFREIRFELSNPILILREKSFGFTLIDSIYTYYSKIDPDSYSADAISSFPTIKDCYL